MNNPNGPRVGERHNKQEHEDVIANRNKFYTVWGEVFNGGSKVKSFI